MENFNPALPMATGGPFSVPDGPLQRYTTSQLLALSTEASERLLVAYCTDCYSSDANMTTLYGDTVYWNGYNWLTVSDSVPATTNWIQYALSKARFTTSGEVRPSASVTGDTGNPLATVNSNVSGTGASSGGVGVASSGLIQFNAGPGTTSTGTFRATSIVSANATTTAPVRNLAHVMNYVSGATALSNVGVDNWYWKFGMGTPVFSASATLQADEICFVMDDANTLGLGATGTELYALIRLNGTTLDFIPTGINPTTTSKHLIASWVPTGPGAREGTASLSVADDLGALLTTVASRSGSFAGAITAFQTFIAGAKTLGTGSRSISRRWMKAVTYRTGTSNGGVLS